MGVLSQTTNIDKLHEQIPHAIWLDGPTFSANQVGVRGISYREYESPEAAAVEPHTLILYMTGGTTVQRSVQGREERAEVKFGDISIHPAATGALWRWTEPLEVLHVYITPAKLRAVARQAFGEEPRSLKLRHKLCIRDRTLTQLLLELVKELSGARSLGAEVTARAIGDRLIVHLLREHVSITEAITDSDRIAQVREYITDNLGEPLELEELAEQVGLGKHHFSRIFRDALDQSPMEYVRERRLIWARNLLESTDGSISDIALMTGFSDQSHLTRWFKRHFGLPPARWRRTYAE